MYKLLLLPILLINSLLIHSQAPPIQWQKELGGSAGAVGNAIEQTDDGGYIVAGSSFSNDGDLTKNQGLSDFWIVKLNDLGIIQWQKSIGGTDYDYAYSINKTKDGGYIVAGNSYSNDGDVTNNHGGSDCWVVKLDNSGIIQWQKCLGGTANEFAHSIEQTTDEGYIIGGSTASNDGDITNFHGGNNDSWVIKLNNSGVIQWQKCFGGDGNESANSIQQTKDGGYIIAGSVSSLNGNLPGVYGMNDFWVIKIDTLGLIEWDKFLGGTQDESASSIKETKDGGYIIAGQSGSTDIDVTNNRGGYYDYWVVKLSDLGAIQWQKCLGGSNYDEGTCVQQTNDGGYIVGGASNSINGDINGNLGGYDSWIVKLDDSGATQWQKSIGSQWDDLAYSIIETADNSYVTVGSLRGYCGIVKLNTISVEIEEGKTKNPIQISPNPSGGKFYFNLEKEAQIKIYDLTGRLILNEVASKNSFVIDLMNTENGIYFYEIIGRDFFSGKLIKQ